MGYIDSGITTNQDVKYSNRWILSFDNVNAAIGQGVDNLTLVLKTASRPKVDFNAIDIHRKNERYYLAGKAEYGTIDISFYDYVKATHDPGRMMYEWLKAIYDPGTADMGYKSQYAFDCNLRMEGPAGQELENWVLEGCWPMNIDYGSLDYSNADAMMVTVTLRIDRAKRTQGSESDDGT